MSTQFQELRDYLENASRGFATMRGQSREVAQSGYRAGKMFQNARKLLDQAMESPGEQERITVPPDPPEPKPKNGPRKKRI